MTLMNRDLCLTDLTAPSTAPESFKKQCAHTYGTRGITKALIESNPTMVLLNNFDIPAFMGALDLQKNGL